MVDGTADDAPQTGDQERGLATDAWAYVAPAPDRVARIVAALRAARAGQADGRADDPTGAVRRESTGVRGVAPVPPALRWDPGARYRASLLAGRPLTASGADVGQVHAADVPGGPGAVPAVPGPPVPLPPVPGPPLAGRLFRGPARRTAVFDREIWRPEPRSSRVPRDVGDALLRAVERYRTGSISTSGLVRAIAETHAA